jgi:hypothetical protein
MAHQYRDAVGPWSAFLGVLQCSGHSAQGERIEARDKEFFAEIVSQRCAVVGREKSFPPLISIQAAGQLTRNLARDKWIVSG